MGAECQFSCFVCFIGRFSSKADFYLFWQKVQYDNQKSVMRERRHEDISEEAEDLMIQKEASWCREGQPPQN